MHEEIDPYRQWLGRMSVERPLNHYQLLDLPDFEEDPERIENAEMIAMAAVLRHESGPHAAAARTLCEELERAAATLSDPARKAAYDDQLRSHRAEAKRNVDNQPARPPIPRVRRFKPAVRKPSLLAIPIRPLLGTVCALGLAWGGFQLCGSGGGTLRTYPVMGTVSFADGQPLAGGSIELESTLPAAAGLNARGQIRADGTFELSTYGEADGAIQGAHRMILIPPAYWETPNPSGPRPHSKYASYATSGLTLTVEPGENRIPITIERP
jgi:hypothetical protein